MADTILVIAEQREGKLNRVSMETIAAAQAIAAETGATVEAALFGSGISTLWFRYRKSRKNKKAAR